MADAKAVVYRVLLLELDLHQTAVSQGREECVDARLGRVDRCRGYAAGHGDGRWMLDSIAQPLIDQSQSASEIDNNLLVARVVVQQLIRKDLAQKEGGDAGGLASGDLGEDPDGAFPDFEDGVWVGVVKMVVNDEGVDDEGVKGDFAEGPKV